jgi:hypothetical protein
VEEACFQGGQGDLVGLVDAGVGDGDSGRVHLERVVLLDENRHRFVDSGGSELGVLSRFQG